MSKSVQAGVSLRYRGVWLALGWVWVTVIYILCLMPSPPEPLTFPYADKVEHLLTFAFLMGWFGQFNRRLLAALWLVLMGISIEVLQGMGGVRMFELNDMVADALGVGLGLVLLKTPLSRTMHGIEQWLKSEEQNHHA